MSSVCTVEQVALLVDVARLNGDGTKCPIHAQMNRSNNLRRHPLSRRSAVMATTYRPVCGPSARLWSSWEPRHELIIGSAGH
jgi:hypothetical protein